MKIIIIWGVLFFLGITMGSCVTIKPYERAYLNDPNMKLSSQSTERFETNFQIYREASAGANGGKTGGGCGCN